jgi:branched-chain amino acid transport system substrate-binding protein
MSFRPKLTIILAMASVVIAAEFGSAAEPDKEIKIGNTMPHSGPASAYGIIGKAESAYFNMLNEQGSINGRSVNFIGRLL